MGKNQDSKAFGSVRACEVAAPVPNSPAASRSGGLPTRKSQETHRRIVEGTVACFLELGYQRTTTSEIAKRVGLTRGAVQYYFPTTADVLRSTIRYLHQEWMIAYEAALAELPEGIAIIDAGIDLLWELVRNPYYVAWLELSSASRTDSELDKIVREAYGEFEKMRAERGVLIHPILALNNPQKLDATRDFARVLLEGLATTVMIQDAVGRQDRVIGMLKDVLRELWQEDILRLAGGENA